MFHVYARMDMMEIGAHEVDLSKVWLRMPREDV